MDRRVTHTKAALTRALFSLLEEKEFNKITVTELTRRADMDRKTFYLHYQTVGEILEEFYQEELKRLEEAVERERIFGERLDVQGFFRVLTETMEGNVTLYRQLAKGPAYTAFERQLTQRLCQDIGELFRNRMALPDGERQLYSAFYAAAVMAVYRAWLKGELDMDEETLAQRVGQVVAGGLNSIQG